MNMDRGYSTSKTWKTRYTGFPDPNIPQAGGNPLFYSKRLGQNMCSVREEKNEDESEIVL